MAHAGQIIHNPVSGERITLLRTARASRSAGRLSGLVSGGPQR